jgi:hypothetical protein
MRIMADEQALVFEGHLHRALNVIDSDIVMLRPADAVLADKTG